MYSRKLGIATETIETNNDSFNERVREQWSQKRKGVPSIPTVQETPTQPKSKDSEKSSLSSIVDNAKNALSNLSINLDVETIIILGLILLIITDTDVPDLVLLSVLMSLVF